MANLTILNKIGATDPIVDVVAPAGVTNGNLVVLGTQNADKTYACAAPAAITDKSIAIVAAVPLSYEVEKTENDYTIATSEVVRAYIPVLGRVMSFPVANFTATATAEAGHYVIPDASALKAEIVAALGGTESVAWIIDEAFTKCGVAMIKIRCIKA
jgi:hypothetical protein